MECGAMSEIQRHIPFYHCDKTPLSMQLLEEAFGMVAGDRLEKQSCISSPKHGEWFKSLETLEDRISSHKVTPPNPSHVVLPTETDIQKC